MSPRSTTVEMVLARLASLPLPPLAPRVGAGPPPRARGPRPRRRLRPLHLARRLRGAGRDHDGARASPRM